MAEFIVTAPDGTKLRVRGPEGSTSEQAVAIAQAQWQAKPAAAPTTRQKLQASLPGRVLQGARDAIDGGAQLLPRALGAVAGLVSDDAGRFFQGEARRVDAINAGNEQEYQAAREATGQSGFDGGRLIGNVVSPVNAAAAAAIPIRGGMTAAQLIGRGAAAGAVGGALSPVNDPQAQQDFAGSKAGQVALGAVTGGVLTPVVARGADAAVRRLLRPSPGQAGAVAAQQVDEAVAQALRDAGQRPGAISAEGIEALRQQAEAAIRNGQRLDVAAVLRKQDFESLGMTPLLGQITRDPMQFARERNLRGVEGVGEPIMARLTDQRNKLSDLVRSYSQGAGERADAGQSFADTLGAVDERMAGRVRDLYTTARQSTQADLNVPLQGLAQDVAEIIDRFGDKVPSGVRNQIANLGLLTGRQQRVFTLNDADRLLKVINDNVSTTDAPTNAALTAMRQSLRNAVDAAVPAADNPFRPAVQAAAQRFQLQDAIPALRAAASDGVNEDKFVRQYLLQARPQEVGKLADLLKAESPEAFGQARAQVGAFLERAAYGQNQAGDKAMAAERFSKALDDLGTARLRAFFEPGEITQLRQLARVGAYIGSEPGGAVVNRSGTASAGANILMRLLQGTPGGSAVSSVGNAAINAAQRGSVVDRTLAAQAPQVAADLTPEQARALARILGPLSIGSGVTAGSTLR
jgi:hypothetical protein